MATDNSINSFDINDVSEGCNYSDDLLAVTKKQSPNSMNVEFFNGRIRKRQGELSFTTPPSGQGGIDSFTKLLLHADGTDGSMSFVDSELSPKAITNTETYDASTVLMLHCEGADGGTTFTDSSVSAKTVTANGGAVTKIAQKKFGSSSGYFDGINSYLSIADSSDFSFGTGDFTIDLWVLPVSFSTLQMLFEQTEGGPTPRQFLVQTTSGDISYIVEIGGIVVGSVASSGGALPINTWSHIAVVRNGTNLFLFVNGTLQAAAVLTPGTDFGDIGAPFEIGREGGGANDLYYNGYIDEFRISKGIARWSSSFPAPAYRYGNAVISTTSPVFGTGSAFFDGSGSNISLSDSTDWDFGSSDFTIDTRVRLNSLSETSCLVSQIVDSTHYWSVTVSSSTVILTLANAGVNEISASFNWSPVISTWYHLALVRSGSTFYLFVNGVNVGTVTSSNPFLNFASTLTIGADSTNNLYLDGYLDEFRVSKGVARWTSNFTIPFLPYDTFTASVVPTGYSLIDFSDSNQHHKQVAHQGSVVVAYDQISDSRVTLRSGAPLVRSFNAKVNNFLIQTYNDYSTTYYWDGSSSPMAALSTHAPNFKRAIEFQGYLIGMNITTAKMRCYYQLVDNIIGDTASYTDYFTLTPAPNDDETSDAFILNGRLYIGTKYGVFRVSFVGGVTVFEFKQAISDVGIVPNTAQVVVTRDFGQVAIFLGTDKRVYLFDGSNIKAISDLFFYHNQSTDISLDLIDDNYKENAFSVYDTTRKIYRLFVTKKASSKNYYCLNVEVETFAYYPFDNMQFSCGDMCYDGLLRPFLVCADYVGLLHKMFIDNNTDNGTAINEYYDSPVISKNNSVIKQGASLTINSRPTSNANFLVYDKVDFKRAWTLKTQVPMHSSRDKFLGKSLVLGSAVLGSDKDMIYPQISVHNTFNYYQFRLLSDTPTATYWEIFDITLDEKELRFGHAEAKR